MFAPEEMELLPPEEIQAAVVEVLTVLRKQVEEEVVRCLAAQWRSGQLALLSKG